MRIVVVGSSGGVGREAVTAGVRRGLEVRAASRAGGPVDGAEGVAVDVRDADAVARAVEGVDAVLWCVGVTRTSGPDVGRVGMTNLVRAAAANPFLRVVTVSGAGITVPGDRKGLGARAVSALTKRLAGALVGDKEAENEILQASDLPWTQVRPPRLVDGPARGWRLTRDAPGPTSSPVPRADVADALLTLAVEGGWERELPFVVRS